MGLNIVDGLFFNQMHTAHLKEDCLQVECVNKFCNQTCCHATLILIISFNIVEHMTSRIRASNSFRNLEKNDRIYSKLPFW